MSNGIVKTLRTTNNFWKLVNLKRSGKKTRINFKNGSSFLLDWNDYWKVRDAIYVGFAVEQLSDKFYRIHNSKVNLVGSADLLRSVSEQSSFYHLDIYQNKTVLDVGAFQGESSALFWSMGAKKVIIFEPVPEHQAIIKENMRLNNIPYELHESGIGFLDAFMLLKFDSADLGFGSNEGSKEMMVKVENIQTVIESSQANIAKFNCEGAEESLVSVPSEILRKIDYYIIMAHTSKISDLLIKKFVNSNYELFKYNKTKSYLVFKKMI